MRYTREELERFRGQTVPDLAGPGMKLAFVGINPGLWTAAVQTHFAHPGNRFYPALLAAGIIDRPIDRAAGMTDDDRDHLIRRGVGITNLVPYATARASEIPAQDLRNGGARVLEFVERHRPAVVAVAGITAYRVAFGERRAVIGRQDLEVGGAALWVVPNPSGLNAHETLASLAEHYRAPALEAGVVAAG